MAPSKLTILISFTIHMLSASAAPVARAAKVPGPSMPGPTPQKRGYDGDWLFSREPESDYNSAGALAPTYNYKTTPEGKLVVVTRVAERRGYDGDWLYSRKSVNAEPKEAGVDAEN
ncbi:hypothetical protein EV426DRAFT_710804 [Tirmania nivea]|nr:hypothetical protein EV426DRAFT_710804 [Tirmania nivea]